MTIEQNLRDHVTALAGDIGERNVANPDALKEAEQYIENVWRGMGYDVARQAYVTDGVEVANLEVTRPGAAGPEKIILAGAHYDTVSGSPGANDNGSGVAAMLEVSRAVAEAAPGATLRFVAFVNEEPPYFHTAKRGSRVYAKMARIRGDDIRGMMSLETMGCYSDKPGSQGYPSLVSRFYPDTGNYIAFVSSLKSRRWMREAVDAFRAGSRFPAESLAVFTPVAPGAAWSDHSSFWEAGYPALMVTDTAFYRYPYYHSPYDTPEKIDYERLALVTDGLARSLVALAGQ